ncbi:hypothetical protein DW029_04135 [Collinsella sp. AF38-3AC]|nr:hypothetical protein DW029_04135 [Collinsella sp. AF38-3AC]
MVLQVQVAQGYRRAQTSRRFAEKLRFGWVRDALVSASVAIGRLEQFAAQFCAWLLLMLGYCIYLAAIRQVN